MPSSRLRAATRLAAVALLVLGGACSDDDGAEPATCRAPSIPTGTRGRIVLGAPDRLAAPWYEDAPDSGKGYESEVGYAIARALGFRPDRIRWVQAAPAAITAPGRHPFDLALAAVDRRAETTRRVDVSLPYLSLGAAVLVAEGTPAAGVQSGAELVGLRVGVLGTAFEPEAVARTLGLATPPIALDDLNGALGQLGGGQLDALVLDVPSALAASRQAPGAVLLGQLQGLRWQVGAVLDRGDPLTACVDRAIRQLQVDGSLERLQQAYLADELAVPVLPAG